MITPTELGIAPIEVTEDADTLLGNAELKARAYFGKTNLPILANDTGFWVQGEGFVIAPKRAVLADDEDESKVTRAEFNQRMLEFWQGVARKYGGKVDGVWHDAFVCLLPNGQLRTAESYRGVTLTDKVLSPIETDLPIRSLYISKATQAPAGKLTERQWHKEQKPVRQAMLAVIDPKLKHFLGIRFFGFVTTLVGVGTALFIPVLLIITGVVAKLLNCQVDEASAHGCLLFGIDIGNLLYVFFVSGWFMLITIPLGVLVSAIGLLILLVGTLLVTLRKRL